MNISIQLPSEPPPLLIGQLDPVPVAHPDRLQDCFDAPLQQETLARLKACRRVRGDLDRRLGASFSLNKSDLAGDPLARDILLGAGGPLPVAWAAGAAWHARSLREMTIGPQVKLLIDAIGRDAFSFGLRNPLDRPNTLGGDAQSVIEAIRRDGLACLATWCDARDVHRDWLRIRLPLTDRIVEETDADHALHGPALVACVLRWRAQIAADVDRSGQAEA